MAKDEKIIRSEVQRVPVDIASNPGPSVRVLAVDDEHSARRLLSVILGQCAFACTTANGGEEALEYLRRERFDAVISDLQMPGMSGMELLTHVRRSYPHVAFLVATGVDDVDIGVEAMRSGADDYLVKPLRENAVLASLESALRKRDLERQVKNYQHRLEEMVEERTSRLHRALQHIERSYVSTLQALGAAIALRDNETAGHSQRVCQYSLEIARAMGWSDEQLESLAKGAYLHDIGKLGIPDSILLKPGPLTADERTVMQGHVQIGFDLVKNIDFLAEAAEIILAHHERYDGGGYPWGLRGDAIPLGARIFAVADTLDAITSDRPYRRASSFEEAHERIRREAGLQFDPEVVRVFLEIPTLRVASFRVNTSGTKPG